MSLPIIPKYPAPWTDLHKLCKRGDEAGLKRYLAEHPDVNPRDHRPLNLAIRHGNLAMVKCLFQHGGMFYPADYHDWLGDVPLIDAWQQGNYDIVTYLLHIAEGDDSKLFNQGYRDPTRGSTILHLAALYGSDASLLEVLAKYYLNKQNNRANYEGLWPIHYACYRGDVDFVRWLLENASKQGFNDPIITHYPALTKTWYLGGIPTVTELTIGDNSFRPIHSAYTNYGEVKWTPLLMACLWGDEALVSLLLDNRAASDDSTLELITALHIAVVRNSGEDESKTERKKRLQIVKVLLSRDDVKRVLDHEDATHNTALHYAVKTKSIEDVLLLLRSEAKNKEVIIEGYFYNSSPLSPFGILTVNNIRSSHIFFL